MQMLELARDLIGRKALRTLAICLGALLCTGIRVECRPAPAVADDVSLVVLRLPSDVDGRRRMLLWAALRNGTARARVICVAGWGYKQDSVRGPSAAQTSPHACSSRDSFRIVGPHETLYWPLILPVVPPPVDVKFRLALTLVETTVENPRQRSEQEVSWEGSLTTATSESKRLFGK
jgi:hypothetical protein